MDSITQLANLFLHLDDQLQLVLQTYGIWTYALLFLAVSLETGLIVALFLPSDGLLFVASTFAATGALDLWSLFLLSWLAATVGDTMNYTIGRTIGPRVFECLKPEYLERTRHFYARHGARAIILARFLPLARSLVPLIAGVGRVPYRRFIPYNILGTLTWSAFLSFGGYLFGSLPLFQEYSLLIIPAIAALLLLWITLEQRLGRKSIPN
ncbi:MAG: VTT domain-containing protein [Chloroflexota bacterium]|nr:VTT domain-containing protein [Chloroflexota bacterium]